MKKMIGILGLILMMSFATAQAQDRDPKNGAKMLTEQMKTKLTLTDKQYASAYDANLEFITASQQLKASEEQKMDKIKKLRAIDDARDEKMKVILTEDQFKDFIIMKKENREALRERRGKQ